MSDTNPNAKPDSNEIDPDQLIRLLDLELMQKRVAWKQAATRHRSTRIKTFAILFVFIAGCAVAFVFLFSQINEQRATRPSAPEPTASVR